MDDSSKIKSILITGCSSGIGLCLANGLRSKGYRVFASSRKANGVLKLKKLGIETLFLDLSSSGFGNDAINELYKKADSLYALINNGAYGQAGALEDISRNALDSKKPKNYYQVTFPPKLFGFLGRILPSSWMDNLISKAQVAEVKTYDRKV